MKLPTNRLARYVIVGATSYAVEISALFVLHHILGLTSVESVAISFWVGFVTAFILQKLVTFQNRDRRRRVLSKQLVGYALLVTWNYIFTLVCVKLFTPKLSVFLVRTAAILVVTLWNFGVYKRLFHGQLDQAE